MCHALKIGFVPWSVLGGGKLASEKREGSARGNVVLTEMEQRVHDAIVGISKKIGKPVTSVAVSWMAARVPSVLVGARTPEQLSDAIQGTMRAQ
jgi:aryl-alcohol dehydrogenase-like predicted oxidoreductase